MDDGRLQYERDAKKSWYASYGRHEVMVGHVFMEVGQVWREVD
jgi:hypothetical protein